MNQVDNYTKVRKLGKGAYGEVWLTAYKADGKLYVMKEVELDDNERTQALKECSLLNMLNHPHIIGYKEYFEMNSRKKGEKKHKLFIIMEYADGPDLSVRIKSQKTPFPEDQVVDWITQILLALKHIHDRKVLHRDLKSENVFSMKDGNLLKLGDFGISKSLVHTSAKAMTQIGTPYYFSPELCMGKAYNAKNDMWALGIIAFELMCRRVPFDAKSLDGLFGNIVRKRHPPLPRNYSTDLIELVDSLLEKEPTRRPSVHDCLAKPFIASRIAKFLTQPVLLDEFSHTILHNSGRRKQPKNPPQEFVSLCDANPRPITKSQTRPSTPTKEECRDRRPSTPNLGGPDGPKPHPPRGRSCSPSPLRQRPASSAGAENRPPAPPALNVVPRVRRPKPKVKRVGRERDGGSPAVSRDASPHTGLTQTPNGNHTPPSRPSSGSPTTAATALIAAAALISAAPPSKVVGVRTNNNERSSRGSFDFLAPQEDQEAHATVGGMGRRPSALRQLSHDELAAMQAIRSSWVDAQITGAGAAAAVSAVPLPPVTNNPYQLKIPRHQADALRKS